MDLALPGPWLTAGTAMGWDTWGGRGTDKTWVLLDGGGWRPGGTHCSGSRKLHWIKACALTPVSKDESPGSRGLGHPLCLLSPDY